MRLPSGVRNPGKALCIGLLVALAGAATAQQSTSYKLEESHFNAGGTPLGGNTASSPSFLISMDSLGDGVGGGSIASASFSIDSGFGAAYAPPGEVDGLRFSDKTTLEWNPEYTLGVYNLYRDLISNLTGLGFGNCQQQDLTSPGTSDGDVPPIDDGYFYLATARNRIGEEGTKGSQSDDSERLGTVCP